MENKIKIENDDDLNKALADLPDEQQLLHSIDSYDGFSFKYRISAGDFKKQNDDPKYKSNWDDDYHGLEVLSPERLGEVMAKEKVDAEIKELEAAGIQGPFYYDEDCCGYPNPVFIISPDDIIELAEKIKAFRAKKQQTQG